MVDIVGVHNSYFRAHVSLARTDKSLAVQRMNVWLRMWDGQLNLLYDSVIWAISRATAHLRVPCLRSG
jgi:hypothetical protein